ncbi:MAG TPA: FAD:protein FMN transferase [Dyadobacter sp.]|jgi:thiamine biosynthesis lipoprotein|nr:FAD:protein FMN transferase [Dyadobacter sp.]
MCKRIYFAGILGSILILGCSFSCFSQVLVKRQMTLMGSLFDISVVTEDSVRANREIDLAVAEIERIENLISEWRPETQVSEVNKNAGIRAVHVDRELFELTKRAIDYSLISAGAFDISIAAMDKIWMYDGSMTKMPDSVAVRKSVERVGFEQIVLDSTNSTIFLSEPGMKIGFGSIGKGYAADRGRAILQANGVAGGIVNASGDLSAWGQQVNGKPWNIGITNPFKVRKLVKILKLKTGSVATSGSYEKYAEIGGTRYSHIINPKTGYPSTGLTSVTIIGPCAEFANALSTSVMVLGAVEGLKLITRFPEYRYVLLTDDEQIIRSRKL